MIKAWKTNIIFSALFKCDHLVSAEWGFWTPRMQGHFSYMGWSLEKQHVPSPWLPPSEGRPASNLWTCYYQMGFHLQHGCSPSLCGSFSLPPTHWWPYLLLPLPLPSSSFPCPAALAISGYPAQLPCLVMWWPSSPIPCSSCFPSV